MDPDSTTRLATKDTFYFFENVHIKVGMVAVFLLSPVCP